MIAVITCGHRPDDERIYEREIKTLLEAGYKITYFTRWQGDNNLSDENLWHRNYSQKDISTRDYIQGILRDFQVLKPSIVHIHEFELLPLAKKAKKLYNAKIIYDVHDTLRSMWETFSSKKGLAKTMINKSLSFFESLHLKYVDEIILANRIFNNNNYYSEKGLRTTVIENFPRLDNLCEPKKTSTLPLILYQGQISEDRGITTLVDAFNIVQKEIPSTRLRILGTIRSIAYKKTLHEKINKSNSNGVIKLMSEVRHKKVWDYMQEAHIGVIPSLKTPRVMLDTPTKLFEYMSAGCVVVATDVPPVHHFLEKAGELVSPGSAKSLADGMLNILNNEKVFIQYSTEGIKRIGEKYNWEKLKPIFLDVYSKVGN